MKKRLLAALAGFSLAMAGSSAQAAMLVYDPASYGKLIEQAKTALGQLQQLKAQVEQGRALFESLNRASNVGELARILSSPAVRDVLPEAGAFAAAANGDLQQLGELGRRADAIRRANRVYTADKGDAAGRELEAAGDRAARDLALGETVADAGAQRLSGLKTLQAAIDSAPNARAVLDLQARAATEQAMIENDAVRLQGLAMTQAAQDRLQAQRERERMAAARQARMALYRQSFQ